MKSDTMNLDDLVVPQVADITAEEGSVEYIGALDQQLVRLFELKRDLGLEITRIFQDGLRAALGVMRDTAGVTCVGTTQIHIVNTQSGTAYHVHDYPILHINSDDVRRRLEAQLGWIRHPRRVQTQRLKEKVEEIDRSGQDHVQKLQNFTTIERVQGISHDRKGIIYYVSGDNEVYVGSVDLLCGFTRSPEKTDLDLEGLEAKIKEAVPKHTSVFVVRNPSHVLIPDLYLVPHHLLDLEREYFKGNRFRKYLSQVLHIVNYDPDVRTLRTLGCGFVHGIVTGFDLPGTLTGNTLYKIQRPSFYFGSLADRRTLPGLNQDEYASLRYQIVKGVGDVLGVAALVGCMLFVSLTIPFITSGLGYLNTRMVERKMMEKHIVYPND